MNTKLLPALQRGVPIVLTSVAATPLSIPTDDSVALVADDAAAFVRQVGRLLEDAHLAFHLAQQSQAHWQRLLNADQRAEQLGSLLSLSCGARTPRGDSGLAPRPQYDPPNAATHLEAELALARSRPPQSRCWNGVGSTTGGAAFTDTSASSIPPAILFAMHAESTGERAALFAHDLIHHLCAYCEMRCRYGRPSQPRRNWDAIIAMELTISPVRLATALARAADAIRPRPLRLVHLHVPPLAAALRYHSAGATLGSAVHSELLRAQLPAALRREGLVGISSSPLGVDWASLQLDAVTNGTAASFAVSWRALLRALAVSPSEEERLAVAGEQLRKRHIAAVLHGGVASLRPVGCFGDARGDRYLVKGPRAPGHTSASCAAACTGYSHFALQAPRGVCYCGDGYGRSGSGGNHSRVDEGRCLPVCEGEEHKRPARPCGGTNSNAVYERVVLGVSEFSLLVVPPLEGGEVSGMVGDSRKVSRQQGSSTGTSTSTSSSSSSSISISTSSSTSSGTRSKSSRRSSDTTKSTGSKSTTSRKSSNSSDSGPGSKNSHVRDTDYRSTGRSSKGHKHSHTPRHHRSHSVRNSSKNFSPRQRRRRRTSSHSAAGSSAQRKSKASKGSVAGGDTRHKSTKGKTKQKKEDEEEIVVSTANILPQRDARRVL